MIGLVRGARLTYDGIRDVPALLYPEGVLLLNESAGAVVELCDGTLDADGITAELTEFYDGATREDVDAVLTDLTARGLLSTDPAQQAKGVQLDEPADAGGPAPVDPVPVGMVAELTYRCPLQCPYCSNPVDLGNYRDELDTTGWLDTLTQARQLGVLQVHLSGGEPGLRRDLVQLVARCNELGMYTNLITSGLSLDAARLDALTEAGLDHLQLSFQDAVAADADRIAGTTAHERKLDIAMLVKDRGLPLTVNVVLHRHNVGRLLELADLAAQLRADRLELAHTQYYGWGLRNRQALMPTPDQVAKAERDAAVARQRYGDRIRIVHVLADHHRSRPKACMAGWGSRQLVVAPNGDVLPCLAAGQIPGLGIQNVRSERLDRIWYDGPAFTAFRGTAWMREPCRSCELRHEDLGGCRCQAFQLTGDAAATDPVCELSPDHSLVTAAVAAPGTPDLLPRVNR